MWFLPTPQKVNVSTKNLSPSTFSTPASQTNQFLPKLHIRTSELRLWTSIHTHTHTPLYLLFSPPRRAASARQGTDWPVWRSCSSAVEITAQKPPVPQSPLSWRARQPRPAAPLPLRQPALCHALPTAEHRSPTQSAPNARCRRRGTRRGRWRRARRDSGGRTAAVPALAPSTPRRRPAARRRARAPGAAAAAGVLCVKGWGTSRAAQRCLPLPITAETARTPRTSRRSAGAVEAPHLPAAPLLPRPALPARCPGRGTCRSSLCRHRAARRKVRGAAPRAIPRSRGRAPPPQTCLHPRRRRGPRSRVRDEAPLPGFSRSGPAGRKGGGVRAGGGGRARSWAGAINGRAAAAVARFEAAAPPRRAAPGTAAPPGGGGRRPPARRARGSRGFPLGSAGRSSCAGSESGCGPPGRAVPPVFPCLFAWLVFNLILFEGIASRVALAWDTPARQVVQRQARHNRGLMSQRRAGFASLAGEGRRKASGNCGGHGCWASTA